MTENRTFVEAEGGENWDQNFTGAGLADGAAQIVKSIQDGDWLSVGASAATASLDVLGFVENPVKAIGATAIGWLLEHIAFLDSFLDHTTGDPQAVQNAAETFFRTAQDLDRVAAEQIKAFGTGVSTYRQGGSASAREFEARVGPRGDELKALSLQCYGLGLTMNKAGVLVATCRGVIRDLLTEFTWWLCRKATIALAAAPYTGGGSLAALLTDTGIAAAKLARRFADKLDTLVRDLNGLFGMMRKLSQVLGSPAKRALAVSLAKNYASSAAKAIDDDVRLSAADAAQQQVADQQTRPPRLTPPLPEPVTPLPQPPKRQGPGLGAHWTTSGTLDE
jgi:hypothetical protein